MPIYEYRCQDCSHEFEMMQKFSDPAVENCPTCDGQVQKLISRSAFHLKGSGWYVTDYGRNGKSDEKKDGDSDKTTTESSSESSDSKTAAKSDTTSDTSSATSTTSTTSSSSSTSPSSPTSSSAA